MTHRRTTNPNATSPGAAADPLCGALERAQHLSRSRPEGRYSIAWVQAATHVGDMSVLALALLDERSR